MSGTCSSSEIKLKERERERKLPDQIWKILVMNPMNLKMISPVRFQLNCFVEVFLILDISIRLKIN